MMHTRLPVDTNNAANKNCLSHLLGQSVNRMVGLCNILAFTMLSIVINILCKEIFQSVQPFSILRDLSERQKQLVFVNQTDYESPSSPKAISFKDQLLQISILCLKTVHFELSYVQDR